MARSANQKLKLLLIRDYLLQETDADHSVTIADIVDHLEKKGIAAERKSVSEDVYALRDGYGMDIEIDSANGRASRYHVASRDFELPELKVLVDAVQSFKFITDRKTRTLIGKIEGLASRHEAHELNRTVTVADRVKSKNEHAYYNVDALHAALNQGCQVTFKYFHYTPDKKRLYRYDGALYRVSPLMLIWDNENYYLVGYDTRSEGVRHYRVDRMTNVSMSNTPRVDFTLDKAALAGYTSRHFSMYSGEEVPVRLRFKNELADAVLDRLGHETMLIPDGDGWFTITASVAPSPPFFSWVAQFGTGARILGPDEVVEKFLNLMKEALGQYEG